jgi:hypothetical protein
VRALLVLLLALRLSPVEQLGRARVAYERSDYRHVVELLSPLLYPTIRLDSQEQVLEAHRLLGIACWKTRNEAGAEREFAILLNRDPDFHLDPLVDGAEVAEFVDGMRRHMEEELRRAKEMERLRKEEAQRRQAREDEERRRRAERVFVEVRVVEHPYAVNFLPFGAGQLAEGQRGKGWALLAAESTFAAASLGLWIAEQVKYPDGRVHQPSQSLDTANALETVRIATGGAFFALWAIGVVDALRHFTPTSVTTSPLLPTPVAIEGGGALSWQGRF